MLKNKKLLVFIIIILTVGIAIFALSQQVIHQCDMLIAEHPSIDVFPNSEILGTTTDRNEDYSLLPSLLGATHHSRILTKYVADASYNTVVSFYQQKGQCNLLQEGANCYGDLQPFGSYSIGIDPTSLSPKTGFFIQLDWNLCGTEF